MASGSIIVSDRRARFHASPLRHVDPLLFGAPIALAPSEERRAFLDRARAAVMALRGVV